MTLSPEFGNLIREARARSQTPPSQAASGRLERYGNDLYREHAMLGAQSERQFVNASGIRTNADVAEIGANASDMANRSFSSSMGTLERQQRALGYTVPDRDRASLDRRVGLARVLGNVDSRNRALTADQQRREVNRASAGGLRDVVERGAVEGLSVGAQAETQREMQYQQAKKEQDSKKRAALGAIVGIGMSFIPGGAIFAPAVSGAIANSGK